MGFARKLCAALLNQEDVSKLSDSAVLNYLIRGYPVGDDDVSVNTKATVMTLAVDAAILAILDPDPNAALSWEKSNRLSTRVIPGTKAGVYENVRDISSKADALKLTPGERNMVSLLVKKLKVLEGK